MPRDEELLAAARQAAERFVVLYDRALPGLLAYFARRTLDAQVAADLTAETLAEAFASRRRFRDRGEGSASRLALHHRRAASSPATCAACASRTRPGGGSAWSASSSAADDVERIEALIDFEHVGREVRQAFDALRSDQREALRLRVIEGRSYREMASELGCSEETARARVSRGLKRLAAQLDG